MSKRIKLVIIFIIFPITACTTQPTLNEQSVVQAPSWSHQKIQPEDDIEVTRIKMAAIAKKGEEGIPEILEVLELHMKTPYSVKSYGVIYSCIKHLSNLVDKGIYTDEVLPTLVRAIEKQIWFNHTLITANAITKLSGIDVGYNEEFVRNYTEDDEESRKAKIAVWKEFVEKNSAK